ncbi:DUF1330 domain-containing protein [Umezawaea tangerina]|uniref:Uncharacterized protein (DUF1330 family) n=1 Tax=Umezawaea tangerina TaxID=84725 RepID=A0A2T0SXR5_9PSEU|nr:DUF1330 domain-containing protein [Umezawaea tangerina]PRY38208.1 uncharacterized protein (DUF1330 family) [Umezawaea tangerina]
MTEIADHDLDLLLAEDPGGPVVMLNLLRFRPDGGRERYQEYVDALGDGVSAKYGLEIQYLGEGARALVAREGQAWDMVVLVRYPSRSAFVDMVRDPAYQAVAHLRTEALVEGVLQPTVPMGA